MPEPLLAVDALGARRGGVRVLEDISFRLLPGEVLGIAGPAAAGKTTLLDALAGFVRPDTGRIRLDGRDVLGWPPHRLARAGIARVLDSPGLAAALPLDDQVRIGTLARRRLHGPAARAAVERALALVALDGGAAFRPAGPLPGRRIRTGDGRIVAPEDRMRVALARALAGAPRLLLLDEAAASPAPVASALRRLRAEGIALLLVSHDRMLLQTLCDRIAVLRAGRLVRHGPPAEVLRA